jgi:hypothetical protein
VVQAHRQVLADIVADVAGFLESRDTDEESLRAALASFVETWRSHGPVLAASAEIWRSQPDLGREWQANMQVLVDGVAARLAAVPLSSPGVDPEAVAHALIWMNERTAYMAAAGLAPVGLDDGLVDALAFVWSAVLRRGPINL